MSNNDSTGDATGSDAGEVVGKVRKSADRKNSAVRRVAQAADTGDKRDRSVTNRLGFPAIVGLVTLLGLLLVTYAAATRAEKVSPAVGEHWHAVYGVYDCTLNSGAGGYLPGFQSTVDEEGIHSHQDGLMHIHPWNASSTGTNATLRVFHDAMQISVDDTSLALDNGRVLSNGTDCNGEEAVLQVLKWQFWFEAQAGTNPQIFTSNFDEIKYDNDREVYIYAFAPVDAEIPLPPAERFDQLEAVSPIIQSQGPVASETQTFNVPEAEDGEG